MNLTIEQLGVQLLITQAERRKKYLLFLAAVGAGGVAVKMNIPAAGVGGSETETEVGCPLPMQTLNKESVSILRSIYFQDLATDTGFSSQNVVIQVNR